MSAMGVPFSEALDDVSAGNTRIPQSAFRTTGRLAVVDQGRSLIAGFTDDVGAAVAAKPPVIVFGDHTRAIKYVDFPFAMGADGIKVLRVNEGFESKFVYHYLRSRKIPSVGYSRHFKFLRELLVPKPGVSEQRRLAAILDQADAVRVKRRQAIDNLDALKRAIFHDMFERSTFDTVRAGDVMPSMRNGLSPATAGEHAASVLTLSAITQGAFDPHAVKSGSFDVAPPAAKRVAASDFLMCRSNGNKHLVGVGTFSTEDRFDLVFPDTVIAGRVDRTQVTMEFLDAAWARHAVRMQIEAVARTTNGAYKVNQQTLSSIRLPAPPLDLQREFSSHVGRVNAQRATVERALAADDELFASLQQRAFRGEL
jgi:type I restriction enzyme S subunit